MFGKDTNEKSTKMQVMLQKNKMGTEEYRRSKQAEWGELHKQKGWMYGSNGSTIKCGFSAQNYIYRCQED